MAPWAVQPVASPLRFMTWNAQALLHSKPGRRQRKVDYLKPHLYKNTVIAVQEAHGSQVELKHMLHRAGPRASHRVVSSFPRQRGVGGVAIFVAWPSAAEMRATPEHLQPKLTHITSFRCLGESSVPASRLNSTVP